MKTERTKRKETRPAHEGMAKLSCRCIAACRLNSKINTYYIYDNPNPLPATPDNSNTGRGPKSKSLSRISIKSY